MTDETAVLFMAYGTPRTLDEVEPYFTDIRGGRKPSEEELTNLRARYEAVGGRTPLAEMTERQAKGAERLLRARGRAVRAYVGMRHWHPFVREAVEDIVRAGHEETVAVPLAPFYSVASMEGYRKALDEAFAGRNVGVTFVKEWHDEPGLLEAWLAILRESLGAKPLRRDGHVLFTAHSLPKARLPPGDPYEAQLRGFASRVAGALGIPSWSFAFQSVGLAGGEWLGPEVHATVDDLAARGVRDLVVAPIGFLADNLETLHDLDQELSGYARGKGVEIRRAPVPNDRPEFLEALAHVVESAL